MEIYAFVLFCFFAVIFFLENKLFTLFFLFIEVYHTWCVMTHMVVNRPLQAYSYRIAVNIYFGFASTNFHTSLIGRSQIWDRQTQSVAGKNNTLPNTVRPDS